VQTIGFVANRKLGLEELYDCHIGDCIFRKAEASLLLLWINLFFIEDFGESEEIIHKTSVLYPDSVLFLYLFGYFYREHGRVEKAIETFSKIQILSQISQLTLDTYYELGWSYYFQQNWKEASKNFEKFLLENKSPSFGAYCAFQLGVCYEMLQQPKNAKNIFLQVEGLVRKFYTFDQFALRKANQYLNKGGISFLECIIIRASLIRQCLKYEGALELLNTIDYIMNSDEATTEEKVLYHYQRGCTLKSMNFIEQAMASFNKVFELAPLVREEVYIVPYSHYEVGDILLKENNIDQAKEAFLKAKNSFDNYDFDKPLSRRLLSALDKIAAYITK